MSFSGSERCFDLLLIIDVNHDPAEMARFSVCVDYDTAARPNPLARLRPAVYAVLQIKTAAGFDGSRYGLFRSLPFLRCKKGKKHIVAKWQIVGYAKKRPGRIRPKQPVRHKIQVPYAYAGPLDAQSKAFVSNGILGRWMNNSGHIGLSITGRIKRISTCAGASYWLASAAVKGRLAELNANFMLPCRTEPSTWNGAGPRISDEIYRPASSRLRHHRSRRGRPRRVDRSICAD